jgi:hypothetical protein
VVLPGQVLELRSGTPHSLPMPKAPTMRVSNGPVPQFGHKRLQSQRGEKRYAWASHSHHSAPLGPRQAGLFRELFNEGVLIHVKSVIRTGVLTVAYRGPRAEVL